jgi:branched-chain amino acid transport system substrate-binding protein
MIVASILPTDPRWTFSTLQPVGKYADLELGFAARTTHVKNVAVFYSLTPFGQSAAQAIGPKATALGLKVASSLGIDANATDLTPQVQKAKDAGAEAILDILTGPVQLVLAKSMAQLGLDVPLVLSADDTGTFQQASAAYPHTFVMARPTQLYPSIKDARIKAANDALVAAYQKAYGSRPGISDAGRGWDAIQLLAAAMSASHASTGEPLRAALEKVTLAGTGGEFGFTPSDHSGQVDEPNPLAIAQLEGSSFKPVYFVS